MEKLVKSLWSKLCFGGFLTFGINVRWRRHSSSSKKQCRAKEGLSAGKGNWQGAVKGHTAIYQHTSDKF